MLPFRTNVTIFIVEFLCTVLLQSFYAVSKYGFERATLVGLGLIPVLLVFLLSYKISNEGVVVRCLAAAGISSLYYMSVASHNQGMLVFMLLATATTIALFLMQRRGGKLFRYDAVCGLYHHVCICRRGADLYQLQRGEL